MLFRKRGIIKFKILNRIVESSKLKKGGGKKNQTTTAKPHSQIVLDAKEIFCLKIKATFSLGTCRVIIQILKSVKVFSIRSE